MASKSFRLQQVAECQIHHNLGVDDVWLVTSTPNRQLRRALAAQEREEARRERKKAKR